MANPEHVEILKKGVDVWNRWRRENPEVVPDLQQADLENMYLERVNFHGANLKNAWLNGSTLNEAVLTKADLHSANLQDAILMDADITAAYLEAANLDRANLKGASLFQANLQEASLANADLSEAFLVQANFMMASLWGAIFESADLSSGVLALAELVAANFRGADLTNADFRQADCIGARFETNFVDSAIFYDTKLGATLFIDIDLSEVVGLQECHHQINCFLSTSTLIKSRGDIPVDFLRGCGLSDWEIESTKLYQPNLSNEEIIDINYRITDIRMTQAIQINPLFISYSHADAAFVGKIGEALTEKGVRYWRDIRDAKAGKLEKQVDQAMRLNPIVLIVLSETSTHSDWVEYEAGKARKLEKELGRDVLCPIAIDDSWKDCDWPGRLRTQIENYNILPFKGWEDPAVFDRMFAKLLGGLDLFYKE